MHAARAALDVARHAAGLALQVEAQAQRMQVAEHLERDAARGALGGLGEDQLAQLVEQRGAEAQQPVGHQQRRSAPRAAPAPCRGLGVMVSTRFFSSSGTPTLATLAATMKPSANITRHL